MLQCAEGTWKHICIYIHIKTHVQIPSNFACQRNVSIYSCRWRSADLTLAVSANSCHLQRKKYTLKIIYHEFTNDQRFYHHDLSLRERVRCNHHYYAQFARKLCVRNYGRRGKGSCDLEGGRKVPVIIDLKENHERLRINCSGINLHDCK